jgi:hypothetical protein
MWLAGPSRSFSSNLPTLRVRKARDVTRWPKGCITSFARIAILAGALSGCSAQPQNLPAGKGVHASAQPVEQCSMFGVMACRAVTLMSGAGVVSSTCSAYRASDGTRVETCGSETKAPASGTRLTKANLHPVRLSWSDNSNNESEFVIERCDKISATGKRESKMALCDGEWRRVGAVAANITSYVDHTAELNQTYLYRVKAINNAGSSNYTAEVSVTTPSR